MDSKPDAGRMLEFGRYKLFPGRREELADGKRLQVGDRAQLVDENALQERVIS